MNDFTGADIDYDAVYNPQPPAYINMQKRLEANNWRLTFNGNCQQWRKGSWRCTIWFDDIDDWDFSRDKDKPIIQRLTKSGWVIRGDYDAFTVYMKGGWRCAVPYSESLRPRFWRNATSTDVTA